MVAWCDAVAAGVSFFWPELKEGSVKIEKVVIFTDGTAEPNPGPAAIGAIIKDEQGKNLATISQPIGRATSNQAEYRAIIAALEYAIRLGASQVEAYSDSELAVRQINRRYRVKAAPLKPLYQKVRQLINQLTSFTITYIPREQNKEADSLAYMALE